MDFSLEGIPSVSDPELVMLRLGILCTGLLFISGAVAAQTDVMTEPRNVPFISDVGKTVPRPGLGVGLAKKERTLAHRTRRETKDDEITASVCDRC